jgi:predicted nuclease with RNAse H fold
VLTVGVDLAAEPVNTAVVQMSWTADCAEIEDLLVGADDAVLVEQIAAADKAGIDCPLGWPRRFVEFVAQHEADTFVAPVDIAGRDWRRLLANRETDLITRETIGLVPLSVAADRIGLAAMRCAGLLTRLAGEGRTVDRSGAGVVVEVYPAAALKHWGLPFRGYKGDRNAGVRDELVNRLAAAAPWLRLGVFEPACRRSDHALDAVVAALNARAAALGRTTRPTVERAGAASTEGWIALPTCSLADLPSDAY